MIKKSVNRLDDFMEDINDYARNTRLDIDHQIIDFKILIKDCITQLQHMQHANSIQFKVEVIASNLFYGDHLRYKVVLNLSSIIKKRIVGWFLLFGI
jgi:signal transduction histidine kinase